MNKKTFEEPKLEIINLVDDVITASGEIKYSTDFGFDEPEDF